MDNLPLEGDPPILSTAKMVYGLRLLTDTDSSACAPPLAVPEVGLPPLSGREAPLDTSKCPSAADTALELDFRPLTIPL
jgi:hypothetical protein